MLVFIQNSPRTYAWGSTDALPAVLRQPATGQPQAELWLGDHAGGPARVARSGPTPITLIDLIAEDPDAYGVDGGPLPFLLKVLGIGAPLSIQVHPRKDEAVEGFAREEALGIAVDAPHRNYRDDNHKPELLVALTPVRALTGFRGAADTHDDLVTVARAAGEPGGAAAAWLAELATVFGAALRDGSARAREAVFDRVFSGDPLVADAATLLGDLARERRVEGVDELRRSTLELLADTYPADAGIIVSLLTNIVELEPGESIFLNAGAIHAYLSGVGVEVMASSDNVLRAGLTQKHVDVDELRRIVDLSELEQPKFQPTSSRRGITTWQPPVPDFALHRVQVDRPEVGEPPREGRPATVVLEAPYPLVMIVTEGVMRVERAGDDAREVASVRHGQSLYISAGAPIEFSGAGEAFIATVGDQWACRNPHARV